MPVVPDQLAPQLAHAPVQELIEHWRTVTLADVKARMPEPTVTDLGEIVELTPSDGRDIDETRTMVLALAHNQPWSEAHYIRAEMARSLIMPDSRMWVLPNNPKYGKLGTYSDRDQARLHRGNMYPLYDRRRRQLDAAGVSGKVILSGFSKGANIVAAVMADFPNFEVAHLNADEAVTGERSGKKLRGDFLASGGWSDQRAAITESRTPALSQAMNRRRLAVDYARFGISAFFEVNQVMAVGMAADTPAFSKLVREGMRQFPDATVKIGVIEDSNLSSSIDFLRDDTLPNERFYSGPGAHGHPTGDNAIAHTLMIRDGLLPRAA